MLFSWSSKSPWHQIVQLAKVPVLPVSPRCSRSIHVSLWKAVVKKAGGPQLSYDNLVAPFCTSMPS